MTATLTHPALKEWSAAVHALLDGRQTVLLRKGGISEKRFEVAADRFVLFPTVAHSHAERVRPEHQDLLEPAAADSDDDHVVLRAGANIVAAVPFPTPPGWRTSSRCISGRTGSVHEDRLDFRPKHRLTVLVVQACPLVEPVRLTRTPDYAGCTSWVDVPVLPAWGAPVHDDATLLRIADRVRRASADGRGGRTCSTAPAVGPASCSRPGSPRRDPNRPVRKTWTAGSPRSWS